MVINDEAIQWAVETLSRGRGTAPGPGGAPFEFLKALWPRCARMLAEAMTAWSSAKGYMSMPLGWQISRLSPYLEERAQAHGGTAVLPSCRR